VSACAGEGGVAPPNGAGVASLRGGGAKFYNILYAIYVSGYYINTLNLCTIAL